MYRLRTTEYNDVLDFCCLGVAVDEGAAYKVIIRNIDVNNLSNMMALPYSSPNSMEQWLLTTGIEGGEDIPYKKVDSAAADLPSQVLIRRGGASTVDATKCLRANISIPNMRCNAAPPYALMGSRYAGLNMGGLYFNYDSNLQDITLREGEGISWLATAPVVSGYLLASLSFTVGTDTYMVGTIYNTSEETAVTIFNGVGSGVVIQIRSFGCFEVGESPPGLTSFPYSHLAIIPTDGFREGGIDVTPIKMDSANAAVPASVKCQRNAPMYLFGERRFGERIAQTIMSEGAANDTKYFWHKSLEGPRFRVMSPVGYDNYVAGGSTFKISKKFVTDFQLKDLTLNPGEGIAIVWTLEWKQFFNTVATNSSDSQSTANKLSAGYFEYIIDFDVEAYTPPSSGGSFIACCID